MISGTAILLNMLTVFIAFVVIVVLYALIGLLFNMRKQAARKGISFWALLSRFVSDAGAIIRHEKDYNDVMRDHFWDDK